MRRVISKWEVLDFKKNCCNENKTIAELIKKKLFNYFIPPILDVGAGLGDIAYNAFPKKETVCIDINEIKEGEFPISKYHRRQKVDFFDFISTEQIKTVFICHAIQCIDEDLNRLNDKIREINPEHVILVLNNNDDFMGELIDWSKDNIEDAKPERHVQGFPGDFTLKITMPFNAKIQCLDLEELTRQIGYLMMVDLSGKEANLTEFLRKKLVGSASFSFRQTIFIYERHER